MNRPSQNPTRPALSPDDAHEYASWFRCLADGTRLLVLNAVATAGRAMTVGEIVDRVGVGQSTVSHHLRVLAEERFVHMQADGTRTLVTVNPDCLQALPEAAARIMGSEPA
ncbi:MAG: metalloregulator ArsR/SmtB family transcription factor [Acidimicrobiaceae bacterium]|nr:metalloregulator ArsR/SmtB family transcription factor [Gemmatimonadota bacterium]MCY3649481.1 metalloregulator ArsR/SmtB family transcription factor [Acidimicrobiaceae bacterium]MDE0517763.1 metalloregulator ArsR/SmtB family transcription factor [Acidimicrobiaceae bacterium]